MEEREFPRSAMGRWENIAALLWLPIHILGLPLLLVRLVPGITAVGVNFWTYVVGCGCLMLVCIRFLRRDFDRLWERPLFVLAQAGLGFCLLMAANIALSLVLTPFLPEDNPNNQALLNLAKSDQARITTVTVVMAPILEELIFRGGIFGLLRRRSRIAAYAVCLLLFGLYHTWQFALEDPVYWLYLIQYLPAGWMLCRAYEKTECIWTPILLHILNNGVSLWALQGMGG